MTAIATAEQPGMLIPPDADLPDFETWPVTTYNVPQQELLEPVVTDEQPIAREYEPPHSMSDHLRNIWVGMVSRMSARSYEQASHWHEMSRTQRALARLSTGSALTLVGVSGLLLGRSSGAAAVAVEDTGIVQHLPDVVPALPSSAPAPKQDTETVVTQLLLVAHNTTEAADPTDYDGAIDLKADPNAHPEPVPIGKWNEETGHGTVWNQVVEYADEMGYSDLTEHQKWHLVDDTLDHNSLTWDEATRLSRSYEPELLTRNQMEDILDTTDAKKTHAADLPTVVQPAEPLDPERKFPDGGSGTDTGSEGSTTVTEFVDPFKDIPKFPYVDYFPGGELDPDPDWVIDTPLLRTRVDDDLLIAAAILGTGALAYAAGRNRPRPVGRSSVWSRMPRPRPRRPKP